MPLLSKLAQAVTSAGTSRNQIPELFTKKKLSPGTRNIDIGGGKYETGTEYLTSQGVNSKVFDPFNRTEAHNIAVFDDLIANGPYDTATVANVLNTIAEPEVRSNIIHQANRAITPEGKAYFQIYQGDKSGIGRLTNAGGKDQSWQNNMPAEDYMTAIRDYFGDAVRHGNIIEASQPKDMGKALWLMSKGGPVRQYAIPAIGAGALAAAMFDPEYATAAGLPYDPPIQESWNPIESLVTAPVGAGANLLKMISNYAFDAGLQALDSFY